MMGVAPSARAAIVAVTEAPNAAGHVVLKEMAPARSSRRSMMTVVKKMTRPTTPGLVEWSVVGSDAAVAVVEGDAAAAGAGAVAKSVRAPPMAKGDPHGLTADAA